MKKNFLLSALFCFWAACALAQQSVATYYSSPDGDYRDIRVNGALRTGNATTTASTASFFGNLTVHDNDAPNTQGTGGALVASDNFSLLNAAGNYCLLCVNASTNRVGVGTNNPQETLDVRGDLKSMIVSAFMDPLTMGQPWAEMSSERYPHVKFTAVYHDGGDYRFVMQHIDGHPLYMQSLDKTADGVTLGQGRGQVIVRGVPDTDVNTGLMLGEAAGGAHYNNLDPEVRGGNFVTITSSREYKRDIQPLTSAQVASRLEDLKKLDVVQFRYKGTAPDTKKHIGLIAEDAPPDMATPDKKSISLMGEVYFLMASAKGLAAEQEELRARIKRLSQ